MFSGKSRLSTSYQHLAFSMAILLGLGSGIAMGEEPATMPSNEPKGFAEIPFGSTRDDFKRLVSQKKIDATWDFTRDIYSCKNFTLGTQNVAVDFYFDADGHFYRFDIFYANEAEFSLADYSTSVAEGEEFFAGILAKKFGVEKRPALPNAIMLDKYCMTPARVWDFPHHVALTGVWYTGNGYIPFITIKDSDLAAAQAARDQAAKDKAAKDASKGF